MKKGEIRKEIFEIEPKLRIWYKIKDFKKYLERKSKYKLKFDPRIKKLKTYKGYKIFIVNGKLIRDKFDIDFVMGGNGLHYLYVPMDEIWIDEIYYKTKEIDAIIIHEYTEFKAMRRGICYEKAHDIASFKELIERRKNAPAGI